MLEHTGNFELIGRGLGGVDDVITELMKRPTLQQVHLHDINAALLSERRVHVGFLAQALVDLVTNNINNTTLLPSVNTVARGMFCGAKYTHHTFTPAIKHN